MYYVDLTAPNIFIPCTFVASKAAGKTLLCRESDGFSMVVEPDGSQTRWEAPGTDGYDSAWTQATILSGFIVFRSASDGPPPTKGVVRQWRAIQ